MMGESSINGGFPKMIEIVIETVELPMKKMVIFHCYVI